MTTKANNRMIGIESAIIGLYLIYTQFATWEMQSDFAYFIPRNRLARILILILLLVLWVSITFVVGIDQNLMALEIVMCILLSVIHPAFAIGNFLIFIFLRPWELTETSTNFYAILPRLLTGVGVLSTLFYLTRTKNMTFKFGAPYLPLFGFTLWAFLSTFMRSSPNEVQSVFFELFFKSIMIFLLITQSIRDEVGVRFVKASLIFASLGISIISISRAMAAHDGSRVGSFGLLADPNDIASVMVMIFPFAFYFLRDATSPLFLRIASAANLCSSCILFFYAKSRGATIAMLAIFAGMSLYHMKNKKNAVLGCVIALFLYVPIASQFKRDQADLSASTESRIIYWETATKMAMHSPLFGVGFNGYPENFDRYTPAFIESGLRTAHSSWFLSLAETGFPGFLLFISLYLWAILTAWKFRQIQPDVLFSTLGYGIAMSFLSHTYAIYFYILLGIVFVTSQINLKKIAPQALLTLFLLGAFNANASSAFANPVQLEAVRGGNKPIGSFAPATSGELKLSGSRNETLNFQLKIKTTECIQLKAFGFPVHTEVLLYKMPYFRTEHASFPGAYVGSQHDPLIPLSQDEKICPFLNSKKEASWSWYWGEVKINSAQAPGIYHATLRASSEAKIEQNLKVQLRVFKMIFSAEPSLKLYSEYSTWYGVLGHFGKTDEKESDLAALYADEMHKHRISPIKFWTKVPTTPEVMSDFKKLSIENRPAWEWIDFPKPNDLSQKVQENYWKEVEKVVLAENLKGKSLVYLWDEPTKKEYPKIIALAKIIRRVAPDVKIMITSSAKELESSADIMVPLLNSWSAREQKLQASGKKLWTYLSCMSHGCESAEESGLPDWVLDRPSVWIRSMAWIAHRLGLETLLYYNVDYAYQFYPKKDPWKDLWYFTGNGDGTLFYPGRPSDDFHFKVHTPVDSIRLKLWRESSSDAEYLHWIDQSKDKPEGWNAKYDALVRDEKNWSKNYDQYQELRDLAGTFLDEKKENAQP